MMTAVGSEEPEPFRASGVMPFSHLRWVDTTGVPWTSMSVTHPYTTVSWPMEVTHGQQSEVDTPFTTGGVVQPGSGVTLGAGENVVAPSSSAVHHVRIHNGGSKSPAGWRVQVEIDGVPIRTVTDLKVHVSARDLTTVTLTMLATVDIDTAAVIEDRPAA